MEVRGGGGRTFSIVLIFLALLDATSAAFMDSRLCRGFLRRGGGLRGCTFVVRFVLVFVCESGIGVDVEEEALGGGGFVDGWSVVVDGTLVSPD